MSEADLAEEVAEEISGFEEEETKEEDGKEEEETEQDMESIRARVKEMEEEAEKIRVMQSEVEKQMNLSTSSSGAGSPFNQSMEEKMEADLKSIYVGNVDYGATAEELEAHFHGCGSINRVTILCDRFTGHPKGFAYIEFADKESVSTAVALDESLFRGRQIKASLSFFLLFHRRRARQSEACMRVRSKKMRQSLRVRREKGRQWRRWGRRGRRRARRRRERWRRWRRREGRVGG